MMNKTLKIQLHFQCTMPVFKGKHGSPVQPEIRFEYFIIKHVLYGFVIQIFIFCEKQFNDLHAPLLA